DYNNRILLLWNGHVLNDNLYSSSALGFDFSPDLNSVERVEIVRGPGSPLYGANAMLAVINIIGKTGAEVNGLEASGEYGSGAYARGSVMYGTQTAGGVDAVVSGSWMDRRGFDLYFPAYDDPATNNGIVRDAEREQAVGATARVAYGDLTFMSVFSSRSKRIPTASYGTVFGDNRARTEDRRWALQLEYAGALSPSLRLSGRISFDAYDYSGVYPYEYLQFDGSWGRWWTGRVHAQWDTHESNRFDAGVEFRTNPRADYRVWALETYDYARNAPFDVASLFVQDTYQILPEMSVSLALRADHHSVTGWLLSPRLAVVANPGARTTLKALYGEAFRAPSMYELYYEEGEGLVSNPSLRPERVRTLELTGEQRISNVTYAQVSVYQFSMWDLIEQTTLQGEAIGQHKNIGSTHARGIEAELITRTPAGHTASLSVGTQSGEGIGLRPELVNSPRTIIGFSASVRFLERCEAAVRARSETGRWTIGGMKTDPSVIVNAFLTVARIAGHVDLCCAARNIFDVQYAFPGGLEHLQDQLVQDGRTVALKAIVRW
ncbi:partial Vitamin B12 transporter BtuB, partial [Anaerolineae bacterium]